MKRSRSGWRTRAGLVLISLWWIGGGGGASADAADPIRIENVVWGFDGSVVPQAFNPVSFVVHNNTGERFIGNLWVDQTNYINKVGAPVLLGADPRSLYLEPGGQRRVQMFVYVGDRNSEFSVAWGPNPGRTIPGQSVPLTNPNNPSGLKMGRPATVILFDPNAVIFSSGGKLPRFDESFFPISATGTEGLAAVLLDHQPRWQQIRQQAFTDWLHAGGVVHVFQERGNEFPVFRESLEILNSPLEQFPIGQGRVVRHTATLSDVSVNYIETAITPLSALQLKPVPEPTEEDLETNLYNSGYYSYVSWEVAPEMFSRMKEMTRPDHNWALIYLMAFVYLLIIFPGCWLIGRRRADYRVTYGAMIGAVVLFSMGFKTVGQRGYGERTSQHAVTIARPLDSERILIRQWSNLFVTDGDHYRITHDGTGLLYSTAQTAEAVAGAIVMPPQGQFIVDIPPFSSRTIAAAAVQPWSGFTPVVQEFTADDHLRTLKVQLTGTRPENAHAVYAVYRDQVYRLNQKEAELTLGSSAGSIESFLLPQNWEANLNNYGFMYSGSDESPEQLFEKAVRPLMAHDLGIRDDETKVRTQLADDRVRVYIYAEMAEEMFAATEYIDGRGAIASNHEGRVLYVFDVFRPE